MYIATRRARLEAREAGFLVSDNSTISINARRLKIFKDNSEVHLSHFGKSLKFDIFMNALIHRLLSYLTSLGNQSYIRRVSALLYKNIFNFFWHNDKMPSYFVLLSILYKM